MALITYKGKSQNSSLERKLSDEEFKQIAIDYYTKPDFADVEKQLVKIHSGGTLMNKVYDYYIKEVMSKAIGPRASWSIYDGLHYKPIMEYFAAKTDVNEKIFPKTNTLAQNIETAFRLCGIRYCVKLPNYPISSVDIILSKYNVNNKWYDFSCGWGARLLGALHNDVEYYGTDPNYELTEKLNELTNDYKKVNNVDTKVCIYTKGSEEFIPELENTIGLAFSSPPYFNLEDYVIGNQSYKPGMKYDEWLTSYIRPTIKNIYKYLITNGYFVINVKNFDGYDLESDVLRISKEEGFELVTIDTLKNIKRCHGDVKSARGDKQVTMNNNDENIFIFIK